MSISVGQRYTLHMVKPRPRHFEMFYLHFELSPCLPVFHVSLSQTKILLRNRKTRRGVVDVPDCVDCTDVWLLK